MASFTQRVGLGTLGLLLGFGAPRLAAQGWSVLASDPVGIARGGAGIAYGNSLEAASLNPALLVSLKDRVSAFVAVGQELQITQTTLQSNQTTQLSADRNRFLPSFGAAWRWNDDVVLGLKLDEPFMRHVDMPLAVTSRFEGQAMDLKTHRLEAQGAWALNPNWSFGASLGLTTIHYAWTNLVRVPVTAASAQPVSAANPALGLMEFGLGQEGSKTVPSYSLGFRWAVNSRWTVAGTYVGAMHATMDLSSGVATLPTSLYDVRGYGAAMPGTSLYAPAVAAQCRVQPGSDKLVLPSKATLGVRQRVNNLLTWEADLRYIGGSATELPGYPVLSTPSGPVTGAGLSPSYNNTMGISAMGELALTKRWTLRLGLSEDSGIRQSANVEPMMDGGRSFTASSGFGYQVFGGELSLGYMFRKTQTVDSPVLDGEWDKTGLHATGTTTRIEGMGHLWSIGFKKAF